MPVFDEEAGDAAGVENMNTRTRTGLEILQVALGIGILGDLLLRQTPWGLNVLMFNLAFVAGVLMLLRRHAPERLTTSTYALLAVQIFFASMFVWRDSIELRVADTFAIIVILGVVFLPTLKITARIAGVFQYAVSAVWAGLNSVFAPAALFGLDIRWSELSTNGWRRYAIAAVRGLLVALPLVLIFGALFVSADAVYEGWVRRVLNVDFERLFSHLGLFTLFAWLSAGYYRGILFNGVTVAQAAAGGDATSGPEAGTSPMEKVTAESGEHPVTLPFDASVVEHLNAPEAKVEGQVVTSLPTPGSGGRKWSFAELDNSIIPGFTLGAVEVGVILGLVNLLFLSFVIFQVPYLFGGMDLVQNTPDFKLSEYARRGFGELVAVAAIVLPVLLASHWLLKKDDRWAARLYRVLAGVQIALLFVIMASAAQRLFLLTGSLGYGLTTTRLYPMIFMIWLAAVFILFTVTVLRNARKHFAWAALWSAFLVLGATHVLNPHAFIVRTNIALMHQGREFDADYNSSELSDDAVPRLIEALPELSSDDQCFVKWRLHTRMNEARGERDLRSWNISRSLVRERLLNDHAAIESNGACDPQLNFDEF